MYWDKKEFKKKVGELKDDVEKTEVKSSAWMWIIGGGLVGLLTSCIKIKREEGQPIIAKLNKGNTEEENGTEC